MAWAHRAHHRPEYFAYSAGLFGLGCAWVLTTSMALLAIRRFRLFEKLMLDWKVAPDTEVDSFMAFACWCMPLLLAEPLIQMRKIGRR